MCLSVFYGFRLPLISSHLPKHTSRYCQKRLKFCSKWNTLHIDKFCCSALMAYINGFVLGRYWDAINASFYTVWSDLAHFFPIETTACSVCVSCFLGRTHSQQKWKAKLMQVSAICSTESCWNTAWQPQLNLLGMLCSVTYTPLSFKLPYSYAFR